MLIPSTGTPAAAVALLAEGVDRNTMWGVPDLARHYVALLAEGVDRNDHKAEHCYCGKSPSSRRAWIEMVGGGVASSRGGVALLAEGVDRNPPPDAPKS
mgnify:CR=1 FL=1